MPILHFTRKAQALMPRYATRFQCVGPDCKDNCCHDWGVSLDKTTYEAYRDAPDPVLRAAVAENPAKRSDMDYGRIVLKDGTGECPLLEDKLCAVHKQLGESHLSDTCFTYPRISNNIGGQYEQSMELSCPEVSRLALLAADAFEFVEGPIEVRADVVRTATPNEGFDSELVNELRFFCVNLMRTRELPLWQRLAVLGLFCESITEPLGRRDNAALRALVDNFIAMLEQGSLQESLAALQPDHAAQALVFSTLWSGMPMITSSAQRNEVIASVAAGLGADPQTGQVGAERLAESYVAGLRRLPQALEAAPHLLEHYLLNEILQSMFPYSAATPYLGYQRLVARFGLLRLMLAARCNTDGPLPDADALARTVQVHCRRFHHDVQFGKRVDEALANSAWNRLEKLYSLLPD
jgi:lysine-N-methylase